MRTSSRRSTQLDGDRWSRSPLASARPASSTTSCFEVDGTHVERRSRRCRSQCRRRITVQRTMMKSKIHRATVTGADLHYVGSITLDPS